MPSVRAPTPLADGAARLADLATALASGAVTGETLTRRCLDGIADPAGDGARIFPHGARPGARDQARAWDARRAQGGVPPHAGIPISIKDNIAQAGAPLAAGSRFLAAAGAAPRDAVLIQRIEAAGFVPVGRTNMTELAFSGLGLNPHFGTPANPAAAGRAPGGSSAGAAASVAAGLVAAAVGTDTSGSCRIPAAFCGLVGFKPTARRIPLEGVYPLSPSLDSVGAIANSVACCAAIDAAMAGNAPAPLPPIDRRALTLADLSPALRGDTEPAVAAAYDGTLARLAAAGARIVPLDIDILPRIAAINRDGGFGAIELHRHLRARLALIADQIDPRVLRRIMRGEPVSDTRYARIVAARAAMIAWAAARLDGYDAVLMPTVAIVPPRLEDLREDAAYDRINLIALRNAGIANLLDRCAVTIPCQPAGALPVGLTLMGRTGDDHALLSIAADLEAIVRG